MTSWKSILKNGFRAVGVEVHRYSSAPSATEQIVLAMNRFGIDLVLDVGANQGQFASEIRNGGYSGHILSFEPLSKAHAALRRASEDDSKWDVAPRCAVGDHDGEAEINIAGNDVSSSLLPMLDSHLRAAPDTAYVGKEAVPLRTLDSMAAEHVTKFNNTLLKIDTQGFEWAVLDGAECVRKNMRGVMLELSLVPLYEGQRLWREVMNRLEKEGFVLWAVQPEFVDTNDGRTLQMNGILFRVD